MTNTYSPVCATGIKGLDSVIGGGFPRHRLYVVQGDPGVGKTTLALQYLLTGVAAGERVLYITLSETKDELMGVAASHDWDLSGINILELSAIELHLAEANQNTLFHPSELELNKTTKVITDEVERVKPSRVVFDSLSEMRLLAENPLRYRRQMLALKQFFAGRQSTVLLLDDITAQASDLHIQSIAHGVITLEKKQVDYGAARRRLEVGKIRGVQFREGHHDYMIEKGGLKVFPRLVAAEHRQEFEQVPAPCGLPEFDSLLGGGLDRGTSTLLIGPAGTGKSTISLQQAIASAQRNETCYIFAFDETLKSIQTRSRSVGINLEPYLANGKIRVQQVDPAELPPGAFVHLIKEAVEKGGAKMVIIDSLNGYLNAMPDEKFLNLQLHELLTFLGQMGVITVMTLAQHGLVGGMQTPVDVTYLADTVVLLRYFEAEGHVKQAISVIKKRTGLHERTIREFRIDEKGLRIGRALQDFHGVLTGNPTYVGKMEAMLPSRT